MRCSSGARLLVGGAHVAQVHMLKDGSIHIYSRNSENHTTKYPDVIDMLQRGLKDEVGVRRNAFLRFLHSHNRGRCIQSFWTANAWRSIGNATLWLRSNAYVLTALIIAVKRASCDPFKYFPPEARRTSSWRTLR